MTTLGQLEREGLAVRIWCNRCGHKAERDALTLRLLLGADRPVYGLWRVFRCSECGATGKRQGDVYSMPEHPPLAMGLDGRGTGKPWH